MAFAELRGRIAVASFSRMDLIRMLRAKPFGRTRETALDPAANQRVILDLITRNMLPSRWRRAIEEAL